MKEIFEQYGGAILTAVAIFALVSIITALLAKDGIVASGMEDLIKQFTSQATTLVRA